MDIAPHFDLSTLDPADRQIIDRIIVREGDTYTNRPGDRGGPTKYGITQKTLSKWRGRPVTPADVEALTRAEAEMIYASMYIVDPNYNQIRWPLYAPLRELLIDSGVQHGTPRATRWLQQAIGGIAVDGSIGPVTLKAIQDFNPCALYLRVLATRIKFYGSIITSDPTQAANAAGWMNRMAPFVDREPFLTGAA